MQEWLIQGSSGGQSLLPLHGVPPLELLDEDDEEEDDEDDEDELEDDEAPPPAPATPLDELELASDPPLPPVATGSN